jgi:hypothetical protein
MRGHVVSWPGFLGAAVMVMVLGLWSLTAEPLPGEEVPDSIACSLRGGDCYKFEATFDCDNVTTKFCDTQKTNPCKAQTVYVFSGVGSGTKPDGDDVCCGVSATMCGSYNPKSANCGTTK